MLDPHVTCLSSARRQTSRGIRCKALLSRVPGEDVTMSMVPVMFKNHLNLAKIFENPIFYLVQDDCVCIWNLY